MGPGIKYDESQAVEMVQALAKEGDKGKILGALAANNTDGVKTRASVGGGRRRRFLRGDSHGLMGVVLDIKVL